MTLLSNLMSEPASGPAVILRLGSVSFSTQSQMYRELKESWEFAWRSQQRLQSTPAWQYLGQGERRRELTGVIYPGQIGSEAGLQQLITTAGQGRPLLMTAATGDVLGYWAVGGVQRGEVQHYRDGTPRKLTFTLSLIHYGATYDDLSNAGR